MPEEIEFPVEDFYSFLNDPVFMHKVVFDGDMPPGQRLQARLMWFCPFYMDNSGYREGKSRTATYIQMMQCMLIPNWEEAILSHTLRGANYLFRDHIDFEYETNKYFRAYVKKITHSTSGPRCELINGSSITAYPSDILNDSLRLESLSLHGATVDEATAFPNPDVLWDVIFNRVTKPMPSVARALGITNTIRCLGAAKYTFQTIYKPSQGRGGLVHMVIRRMWEWAHSEKRTPMEYVFNTMNIKDHLPPDEVCWACGGVTSDAGMDESGKVYVKCTHCGYRRIAWRQFFKGSLRRMADAKMLMSPKLFAMRWKGEWQDTSEDVYPPQKVRAMPKENVYVETGRQSGDDKSLYFAGVDIGTGATERHSPSAISVIKITPPDPHFRVVYAAKHRGTLTDLSGHIYTVWKDFGISLIMIDSGGGGVWLVDKDHLGNKEQELSKGGKRVAMKDTTPLIMMDDYFNDGARVLQLFTPTCALLDWSIGKMGSPEQLVNWGHDNLAGLIENDFCWCPLTAQRENAQATKRTATILGAIQEALDGLLEIGIVEDRQGEYEITARGFYKYHPKPDLAYSLMYGVAGAYLFLAADKERTETEDDMMPILATYKGVPPEKGGRIRQRQEAESDFAILVS